MTDGPAHDPLPVAFSRPDFGKREAEAAATVVRSGWVVGGSQLLDFEQRVAAVCDAKHAVCTSNWTTGAFLVLHAWGIGLGDEVIVPSLTFIASVNVIRHCGAKPVFVDVDPLTYNLDPQDVEHRITPRTKAIMPVDQVGLPCDIDAVGAIARRHGLKVLDDAACAIGSANMGRPVGSLADATVFSLHARKVVTTGEGGVIVTNDAIFAKRLRLLRHQGMSLSDFERRTQKPTTFETYPEIGYNFRMTDIQGAIGVVQMERLPVMLERRRTVALRYNEAFVESPLIAPPHVPDGVTPNWQSYQVRLREGSVERRNAIMDALFEKGVPTRRGVMASHLEAPYLGTGAGLSNTEQTAQTTIQMPMHSQLTVKEQDRVVDAVCGLRV